MPPINDDEMYIPSLAVFPQYRGQKVGSALLRHVFEYARGQGYKKISLIAETDNEKAIAVYKKLGFSITHTNEFPKKFHKHNLYGFHKMLFSLEAPNIASGSSDG